jgi:hypothetical protein
VSSPRAPRGSERERACERSPGARPAARGGAPCSSVRRCCSRGNVNGNGLGFARCARIGDPPVWSPTGRSSSHHRAPPGGRARRRPAKTRSSCRAQIPGSSCPRRSASGAPPLLTDLTHPPGEASGSASVRPAPLTVVSPVAYRGSQRGRGPSGEMRWLPARVHDVMHCDTTTDTPTGRGWRPCVSGRVIWQ